MKFTKTNMLLEVNVMGAITVYYTFNAPRNCSGNYHHIIERKDYYVQGLWCGDIIRYYKNENKVEYVNTVTNEIRNLSTREYKIYQDN